VITKTNLFKEISSIKIITKLVFLEMSSDLENSVYNRTYWVQCVSEFTGYDDDTIVNYVGTNLLTIVAPVFGLMVLTTVLNVCYFRSYNKSVKSFNKRLLIAKRLFPVTVYKHEQWNGEDSSLDSSDPDLEPDSDDSDDPPRLMTPSPRSRSRTPSPVLLQTPLSFDDVTAQAGSLFKEQLISDNCSSDSDPDLVNSNHFDKDSVTSKNKDSETEFSDNSLKTFDQDKDLYGDEVENEVRQSGWIEFDDKVDRVYEYITSENKSEFYGWTEDDIWNFSYWIVENSGDLDLDLDLEWYLNMYSQNINN
jgi:hypothetical protein